MKIEDLKFEKKICIFCHPNWSDEYAQLLSPFMTKGGYWYGGWTRERENQKNEVIKQYIEANSVKCFFLGNLNEKSHCWICYNHLIDVANKIKE